MPARDRELRGFGHGCARLAIGEDRDRINRPVCEMAGAFTRVSQGIMPLDQRNRLGQIRI